MQPSAEAWEVTEAGLQEGEEGMRWGSECL